MLSYDNKVLSVKGKVMINDFFRKAKLLVALFVVVSSVLVSTIGAAPFFTGKVFAANEYSGTAKTSVGSGGDYTCILRTNGTIGCLGGNRWGQLGNGTTTSSVTLVNVSGISTAVSLYTSSNGYSSCAILANGTIKCWGQNDVGQLGNGTMSDSTTPVNVFGINSAISMHISGRLACALLSNGTVRCWGFNYSGGLGISNDTGQSSVPITVQGVTNATAVSNGQYYACALIANGTVKCWGSIDGTGDHPTPTFVPGLTNVIGVTASNYACALIANGTVKCWGNNYVSVSSSLPVTVSGLSNVNSIAGSSQGSCAVLANGTMKCWGWNDKGQLGDGTLMNSPIPVSVVGLNYVTSASVSANTSCAMTVNGVVKCWGQNDVGQLGNGTLTNSSVAVTAANLSTVVPGYTTVSSSGSRGCELRVAGSIRCWGASPGNGTDGSAIPVNVTGIVFATAVSVGGGHTCALIVNGTVKCWGDNTDGQIGNGLGGVPYTNSSELTPVSVIGVTNAVAISSGDRHSCALISNGTVKCWGNKYYGQVGNGTDTFGTNLYNQQATPDTVVSLAYAVSVAAGANHTCAVLADGTEKCWGKNNNGEIGSGAPYYSGDPSVIRYFSSLPVPVSDVSYAKSISVSHGTAPKYAGTTTGSSCALLANGTVKCWGVNSNGQLGNGLLQQVNPNPSLVSGQNLVKQVSVGAAHSCIVVSNGTVRCWGDYYADPGVPSRGSLIPVTIVGVNSVFSLSAGGGMDIGVTGSCAIVSDGTAKCW